MPVSKNRRKSRKGQNRKKSKAKEANNLGAVDSVTREILP